MDPSLDTLAIVRRLAPPLCASRGIPLPGRLLEEGLPESAPPAGGPVPVVDSVEDLVSLWVRRHPNRRRAGLYLTPAPLAEGLLALAWDRDLPPRAVLDPAVGAGAFLLAARKRWGSRTRLH
ncbi:MAG: hypothetical protein GF346_09860, partial [Candidatus Eisenbacteria bacterium]|nr:hypothetical protein [Candidatus Latescibacterota bacterium]MBD3302739.1 hypothetical protein [Candidatus Eisenbacteria bacterium]